MGLRMEPEIRLHPDKEKEQLGNISQRQEGQLQAHYHRKLREWLSAGKINTFQQTFKQLLNGQKVTSPVNEAVQDCFRCLDVISQIRTAT